MNTPVVRSENGRVFKPRIGRYPAWAQEQQHAKRGLAHDKPRFPKKRLEKVIKRIREVNQKLVAFERGFIHEEGIKDREWYRHLGVAPGKWLGQSCSSYSLSSTLTMTDLSQDMELRLFQH